ncbi:hypothetical protein ACH47Z_42330 [Streptomyces sp. NPDC020192]|uniref:hypothetical protein n=1 Tax=Streptomyces sp. NPDC020192 TaxID=3365066 RepID=UPI0037B8390E
MNLHRLPPDIRSLHWIPRHLLDTVMQSDDAGRVHDAWHAWEHGAARPLLLRGTPVPVC